MHINIQCTLVHKYHKVLVAMPDPGVLMERPEPTCWDHQCDRGPPQLVSSPGVRGGQEGV